MQTWRRPVHLWCVKTPRLAVKKFIDVTPAADLPPLHVCVGRRNVRTSRREDGRTDRQTSGHPDGQTNGRVIGLLDRTDGCDMDAGWVDERERRTDRKKDGNTNARTVEQRTDRQTDGPTDGPTDETAETIVFWLHYFSYASILLTLEATRSTTRLTLRHPVCACSSLACISSCVPGFLYHQSHYLSLHTSLHGF